jgi:hypothetical protein
MSAKVALKRLWWDQIENDDLQPFCMTELTNTRSSSGETFGDLVIGCGMGTLNVYEVKSSVKQIAVVAGIPVTDCGRNNGQSSPEALLEKRRITVPETEPITHIYECEGSN